MYYIPNELYHYGVPGMKWGVRKRVGTTVKNVTGAYADYRKKSADKLENKKTLTKFGKRMNINAATNHRIASDMINKANNSKTLRGKYSNILGDQAMATRYKNYEVANMKNAKYARNEKQANAYRTAALNNKEIAKYYTNESKKPVGDVIVDRLKGDSRYYDIPYHRVSGRTTTIGRELANRAFTLGIAGKIADKKYLKNKSK